MKPVTDSTMGIAPVPVVDSMHATFAKTLPTWNQAAPSSWGRNDSRKYMRNYVWNNEDIGVSPCVLSTEYEAPLPRPPPSEFSNVEAMNTILKNPHLFPIVCNINVDHFQALLQTHPN
jgi:hypothetical protein